VATENSLKHLGMPLKLELVYDSMKQTEARSGSLGFELVYRGLRGRHRAAEFQPVADLRSRRLRSGAGRASGGETAARSAGLGKVAARAGAGASGGGAQEL
jgi:hypothetical protein